MLLPLDALKIKRQVNPEAFRGRGVVRIFMEEGTTLYRGWGWTMARNAPGSFAVRTFFHHPNVSLNLHILALRCLSSCKRPPRCPKLRKRHLDTKLPRLHRWGRRIHHRRCPARCHQDAHPKRQLRDPRQWCDRLPRADSQRGRWGFVQGADTEDPCGWPEVGV